ncbi:MAG: IPT/TIG domain-containing protein, partial [Candidatus Hydrogenedens sp.]
MLTTTQTSNNETVRVCGEAFYFDGTQKEWNSFLQILPGKKIIDVFPLNNHENELVELFTYSFSEKEDSLQEDGIYYTLIDSSGRIKDVRFFVTGPNWEVMQVYPYTEPINSLRQYAIFQKNESGNISLGRVLLFVLDDNRFIQTPKSEIPIPFAPDIVSPFNEKGMWVIEKSNFWGTPQFYIVDGYLKMSRPFLSDVFLEECSVQEIFPIQDSFFIVMTSCWDNGSSRGNKSEISMFDTKNGVKLNEPLTLYGEGNIQEKNIYPAIDGFWIKTTSFSEGFGYLTFAKWEPIGGWEKKLEYSFSGIEDSWQISVNPSQKIVAVAYNNRLEIVGEPFDISWVDKFEEPITYLNWLSDTTLNVGMGGRLIQINVNDKSKKEWLLTNTGFIKYLFPLAPKNPSLPTDETENGIVIDELYFQSERAGKDVRGILLGKQHPAIIDWEITYINNPVDWLLWYRNNYFDNTYLYLGLIPYSWSKYIPSVWLNIKPIVNQELVNNNFSVSSNHYVRVHVVRNSINLRRILFVWAQSIPESFRSHKDPREIKLLVEILSGAPYFFSCEEISEPIEKDVLTNYGIVIIEAKAIASGMISIKDLLDYVFQGGRLLILGDYYPEGDSDLFNYWLTPLGVSYNPKQRFDGKLPVEIANIPDFEGKEFSIIGGGTLKSISSANYAFPPPNKDSVSTAKQVACLSRNYGYGKIVILSARTPLSSINLPNNDNKSFAINLFQGLTYSEMGIEDTDGDGLFDIVEDRNRNGIVDEGETNLYVQDSDGDGIPDGNEDRNRNGIWDENETDPTCNDSDGDGIWDGADVSPVPVLGKQIITRIEPSEAFAEGGNVVFIQGRNFTNDTQFVFGTLISPSVRIISPKFAIAVVPEFHQDEGGKVWVYAMEGKNKIKIEPGKLFLYKPRN